MKRFIIERDIPEIGSADRDALRAAAEKSNETLNSPLTNRAGAESMHVGVVQIET